jgi:DNA-binding transcriptional ArsR family regulator
MMGGPDEIIHQSTRLRIMAALDDDPDGAGLTFARLKAILGTTDGNLGAHLRTLENAGYIAISKSSVGGRVSSTVAIAPKGRAAFIAHVGFLREVLDRTGK